MANRGEMNNKENSQHGSDEGEEDSQLYHKDDQDTQFKKEMQSQQAGLDQLSKLVSAILPLGQQYVDLQKSKLENTIKRDEKAGFHNRKLTVSLLIFLGLVIIAMAVLTYFAKVSGDALLFLVGIIVGYLMNMIQGLLYSPWEVDTEE